MEKKKRKKRKISELSARQHANSIYSWLEWKQQSIRTDEHHTRKGEGQQIVLLTVYHWILTRIFWTLHPISYVVTQNAAKRFCLCVFIKLTTVRYRFFFPSRMEINSFHIFQHPTTHHVYSLLWIKLSGNLNTSQLENIFPNSKPYLPVRVSIQAGIPGHRKECLLVPRSTAQVLFCWAFFHFRRFFCWLVWGQFSNTLLTFSIRTLSKCQS